MYPGSITGVVFADIDGSGDPDSGRGIAGATVTISGEEEEDIVQLTNKFGEFRSSVVPGKHTITVQTPLNQKFIDGNGTMSVTVEPGKSVDVELPVVALTKRKYFLPIKRDISPV